MSRKRFTSNIPNIPHVPETRNIDSITAWLRQFANEQQRFNRDVLDQKIDGDLISTVSTQVLTDGFTIEPNAHTIEMSCSGNITSSTTTAIKDGRQGQVIILQNITAFTITLKHDANTKLTADFAISQYGLICLRWSENVSAWIRQYTRGTNS